RKISGWQELVGDTLDKVRLTAFADRDGRTLSGGQQRRATLAIGLAVRPSVLLLDEPTASLDIVSRDAVIRMLDELRSEERSVGKECRAGRGREEEKEY